MSKRRGFALVLALSAAICAGALAIGDRYTDRRTARRPGGDDAGLASGPQPERSPPDEQSARQLPESATALSKVAQLALAGEMDKIIEMRGNESPRVFMARLASLSGSLQWLDVLDRLWDGIEQRPDLDPLWRRACALAYGAWGREYVKTQGTLHDLAAAMVHRVRATEPSRAWKRRAIWLSTITSVAVHTSPTRSTDADRIGKDELAEQDLLQLAREVYRQRGHGHYGELFALAHIARRAESVLDAAPALVNGPAADAAISDLLICCSILETRGLLRTEAHRTRVRDLFRLCIRKAQSIDSSLDVLRAAVRLRLPGLDDVGAALCRRIEEGPASPTRAAAIKQCKEYLGKLVRVTRIANPRNGG